MNEIIKQHFIELSFVYANEYKKSPKNFISCFKKYLSIRMSCAWIVWSYPDVERNEKIEEWAKKLNLGKWERVLIKILTIIYELQK